MQLKNYFQSLSVHWILMKKSIVEIGRPTTKLSTLTTKSKYYIRTFKYMLKYENYNTFTLL